MVLSSFWLKIIAIILMFYDHALKILPVASKLPFEFWIPGRIAFPIFCFLLVEGIIHTKSIKKYAVSIGILAIISEFVYDFAFHNTFWEFSEQNVLFELLLGLLIVWLYKFLEEKQKREFIIFPLLFAIMISIALNLDYGMGGILCIFLFYIGSKKDGKQKCFIYFLAILMTATNIQNLVVMRLQLYSLLALIPLLLYNGEKGYKFNKYIFYTFYPLHLILLYIVRLIMLH